MQLTAICAATPDGHRLRVLTDEQGETLLDLSFDWTSFRPASAGHRLIDHGYMIRPDARSPEAVNGWRFVIGQPETWSVPVITVDQAEPAEVPLVVGRLSDAAVHWMGGRHDAARKSLADLAESGTPSLMYGTAIGLAFMSKVALVKLQGLGEEAPSWIQFASEGNNTEDAALTPDRFATRFIIAFVGGDIKTTLSLYGAAFTARSSEFLPSCIERLLAVTCEAIEAASLDFLGNSPGWENGSKEEKGFR